MSFINSRESVNLYVFWKYNLCYIFLWQCELHAPIKRFSYVYTAVWIFMLSYCSVNYLVLSRGVSYIFMVVWILCCLIAAFICFHGGVRFRCSYESINYHLLYLEVQILWLCEFSCVLMVVWVLDILKALRIIISFLW